MASRYLETCCSLESLHHKLESLADAFVQVSFDAAIWVGRLGTRHLSTVRVCQTPEAVIVQIRIPRVIAPEELEVRITARGLVLSGDQREHVEVAGYCDFAYSVEQFQTLISLPYPVQADTAIAELLDNCLTLIVAKAPLKGDRQTEHAVEREVEIQCYAPSLRLSSL